MRTTFTARAIAFARAAGSTATPPLAFDATDRTPEQATALAALIKAATSAKPAFDPAACYAASANADTGRTPLDIEATNKRRADAAAKRASDEAAAKAKRDADAKAAADAAEQAKRAADAKPAKPNANAAAYAERVALIGELRGVVTALYNGPSLAVRTNPKRVASSVYASLLATPKHRTTLDKLSVRDESALFLIVKRGEANGSFDPVALNLDSGIFSRLASVGFIEADGSETFKLSTDAIAHAKRAAKAAA